MRLTDLSCALTGLAATPISRRGRGAAAKEFPSIRLAHRWPLSASNLVLQCRRASKSKPGPQNSYPDSIKFRGKENSMNGIGTRRKFFGWANWFLIAGILPASALRPSMLTLLGVPDHQPARGLWAH